MLEEILNILRMMVEHMDELERRIQATTTYQGNYMSVFKQAMLEKINAVEKSGEDIYKKLERAKELLEKEGILFL